MPQQSRRTPAALRSGRPRLPRPAAPARSAAPARQAACRAVPPQLARPARASLRAPTDGRRTAASAFQNRAGVDRFPAAAPAHPAQMPATVPPPGDLPLPSMRTRIAELASVFPPYCSRVRGPVLTICREEGLPCGGRRPARGSDREQRALGERQNGDGAADIVEWPCSDNGRRVRIGTEQVRRARHAVLRGFEVTDQVVMLERGRHKEEGVDGHPDQVPHPRAAISQAVRHLLLVDHTPGSSSRPAQRPTTILRRAAQPPRSRSFFACVVLSSANCCETPPLPRMPGMWVYWASTAAPIQRRARSSTPA